MKTLLFLTIIILLPFEVIAEPAIDVLSGEASHGSTIMVSGAGFGIKIPAAPLYWKTFDQLTTGEQLKSVDNDFISNSGMGLSPVISLSNQRSSNSSKNIRAHVVGGYSTPQTVRSFGIPDITAINESHRMYVSMWYRHAKYKNCEQCDLGDRPGDCDVQYKLLRLAAGITGNGTESPSTTWIYWDFDTYGKNYWAYHIKPSAYHDDDALFQDGKWHNISTALDQGQAKGDPVYLKSWLSHADFSNPIDYLNACPSGCDGIKPVENWIDTFYVHNYVDQNATPDDDDAYADLYYDDIYIDSTFARIEIGDSSDYESCTHREIQIPVAWSEDEITFTVNHGSFNPDETVYLFIVNADGQVSQGKPISLVGAEVGPTAPSNLRVDVQ